MNFSIEKEDLLQKLQICSKVVPARSTLPILSCVLFSFDDEGLFIRTTDLEISIKIKCKTESGEPGKIAIPINKLLEITSALPEELIRFEISDIGKILISCSFGNYTIMGQSADEFPTEQQVENGKTFNLGGKELKKIIFTTSYAASKDDMKPVLQGVLFQIGDNDFVSVATDGHRLVKFEKQNIHSPDYNGSVVVPIKFLSLMASQTKEEEDVSMVIGDNHIQVALEGAAISSRIINERFPDYDSVIPKDNNHTLVVNRDAFADSIKRVSIFSNKSSKQIALDIKENQLTVSTEDPENITSGKETLDCQYDGEPITIGYNAAYLREVLQHQESGEIKIMLKSPLSAGIFLPMDQNLGEEKTTLLMPIRLND